jgi:hypothetical protein
MLHGAFSDFCFDSKVLDRFDDAMKQVNTARVHFRTAGMVIWVLVKYFTAPGAAHILSVFET